MMEYDGIETENRKLENGNRGRDRNRDSAVVKRRRIRTASSVEYWWEVGVRG